MPRKDDSSTHLLDPVLLLGSKMLLTLDLCSTFVPSGNFEGPASGVLKHDVS